MGQIGRQLEREQGIVQLQKFANVLADGRVSWQLQQAAMVIGNFQLFGRAQHALAFYAAQFANLDQEGFAIFDRR